MARLHLSRLPGWKLADPAQDLRGLKVLDKDGREAGVIGDLIVNTLTELVDGVVLDTGRAYFLRNLRRGDGAVTTIGE